MEPPPETIAEKERKADLIRSAVRPWVGSHARACDAIPFDECSDEESCTRHVCLTQDAPKSSRNSRYEWTEHAPPNTVGSRNGRHIGT
jgi:hypothetical protein